MSHRMSKALFGAAAAMVVAIALPAADIYAQDNPYRAENAPYGTHRNADKIRCTADENQRQIPHGHRVYAAAAPA